MEIGTARKITKIELVSVVYAKNVLFYSFCVNALYIYQREWLESNFL